MAKRKRAKARKKASKKKPAYHSSTGSCTFWGFVIVIVGVLFLLEDLGKITLYGVSWWTAALLLIGLMKITKGLY